jgi:hypothetical protein
MIGIQMKLIKMIQNVIVIGLIVNKMIDYHGQNDQIQHLIIIHQHINVVVVVIQIHIEIFDHQFHFNNGIQLIIHNDQHVDNFIKHNLLNQNQQEKRLFLFFNQLLHQMLQHNIHVINHYLDLNPAQFEQEVNSSFYLILNNTFFLLVEEGLEVELGSYPLLYQ